MNKDLSLNLSIRTDKRTGKPQLFIKKLITDEIEVKILCKLLMENEKLLLPLVIEDKLQFQAKLKEKGVI